MAPSYGWGSTSSRLEPLQRGSLLFITKFPEIPIDNSQANITSSNKKNEKLLSYIDNSNSSLILTTQVLTKNKRSYFYIFIITRQTKQMLMKRNSTEILTLTKI